MSHVGSLNGFFTLDINSLLIFWFVIYQYTYYVGKGRVKSRLPLNMLSVDVLYTARLLCDLYPVMTKMYKCVILSHTHNSYHHYIHFNTFDLHYRALCAFQAVFAIIKWSNKLSNATINQKLWCFPLFPYDSLRRLTVFWRCVGFLYGVVMLKRNDGLKFLVLNH